MTGFSDAAELLQQGVEDRAFPAAAIEVGRRRDGTLWKEAFGALTYDDDAPRATLETVFDLASLTKVIATTTLVMRAIDENRLSLDDPAAQRIPEWRGTDREAVTLRDFLAHCSGLTAYLPFFRDHTGRAEFQPAIAGLPLEYEPRTRSVYSDLGFMLLGFVLDDAYGRPSGGRGTSDMSVRLKPNAVSATTLAGQFASIAALVTAEPLTFNPPRAWKPHTAPTEVDPWRGRLVVGEVHDENAWALGGAAGHAGLFGTVGATGAFARAVMRTLAGETLLCEPATLRQFIVRTAIPGSSRALGWDTMLPTSSCGTRMSPTAVGHTGFTGTSLWIDWERDLYVALLTNRVYPTRDNERLKLLRPQLHDAVVDAFDRSVRR